MRDAVSSGRIAAVDGQGDAVYEAGAGAAQPQHGGGDLLAASEAADRRPASASATVSSPLAIMSASIGVSIVPGQTALTRMPRGAYSSAALLVRPRTPCLVAW